MQAHRAFAGSSARFDFIVTALVQALQAMQIVGASGAQAVQAHRAQIFQMIRFDGLLHSMYMQIYVQMLIYSLGV